MLFKLMVALVSSSFTSIILSIFLYDSTLGNMFPLLFILTGGAYLLGGVPCSLFIDRVTKKKWLKFGSLILAGFFVGIITMIVFVSTLNGPPPEEIGPVIRNGIIYGLYGAFGALIFHLVEWLLRRPWGRFCRLFGG